MFRRIICAFGFVSLALMAACDVPFVKEDPVVVSVGDAKLRESDIRRVAPEWDSWGDREKLTFLEHWIDEETIYQEAVANGVLKDETLQAQILRTERKMTVDYFLQSFADTMMVGDAEKLDYYQAHQELFLRGQTMVKGALLYFKDWQSADLYYKGHKKLVYDSREKFQNKAYRVFASRDPLDGRILKCRIKANGEYEEAKFGKTPDKCFILNDDITGMKCPAKLDKQWYIDYAKRRLKQYGVDC